ncbi:hypothetical protein [Paenibacillus eucommiae]|uniref:Glycosyl hydrolase-like 10 domain-containing protein n=1 Tax=Paenibacillus eucommiae TaxID=1355755 RepID=A0ABS4IMK2_9BACL|nr:hypothetical protein [Paenibacillus eucommiae]MBP1988791.1 hypothetical protein [Paenibacillus eucommiae]
MLLADEEADDDKDEEADDDKDEKRMDDIKMDDMDSMVCMHEGNIGLKLAQSHVDAVNRRRRILVQFDVMGEVTELFGIDIHKLIHFTFHFTDEKGSQIDTLIWDIDYFIPKEGSANNPGIKKWHEAGIDVVNILLEESKKRGLENIWNHRISEVDFGSNGLGLGMERKNRIKADHPDWVVKSWWWQGLWNLASSDLRAYKLDYLRKLASMYQLDGIQLDFSRHVPCLPVGHQWENRGHATEFVSMVRSMLLEIGEKRSSPMLLAAKVPENLEGCHVDGLDVEAWAKQNLVDMFTLGSRTINVDIASFRKITEAKNIKLYPSHDDHHATDGYRYPPIEFFRGVFGNWRQQGADGVGTFNWSSATAEVYAQNGSTNYLGGPISQQEAYHEIGSLETMKFKDKMFVVERRGGYPWSEGYFNRNDDAPLPAVLYNDGRITELPVYVCDDLTCYLDKVEKVHMRLILFGAKIEDKMDIVVNGVITEIESYDVEWKDPQIFSPQPQPASGGSGHYKINPEQRLLMVAVPLTPSLFKVGRNWIGLSVIDRLPHYPGNDIVVEKLEILVMYKAEL